MMLVQQLGVICSGISKRATAVGLVAFTASSLLLSGCSSVGNDIRADTVRLDPYSQVTPKALPRKTITNFTEALQCMDGLMARYRSREILVSLQPVENMSGSVVGVEDMLMTSLSTMSSDSQLVKVVASNPMANPFYEHAVSQSFKAPDVFIRISAPQFENQVHSANKSASVNIPALPLNTGWGDNDNASIISIDMNLGSIDTLQLLPGIFSRNSITVLRGAKNANLSMGNFGASQGGGAEGGNYYGDMGGEYSDDGLASDDQMVYGGEGSDYGIGKITKFGVDFQMKFSYREGDHTAIRTLIELGVIELIGKYAKLPYWQCLGSEAGQTPVMLPTAQSSLPTTTNTTRPFTLSLTPKGLGSVVSYEHGDSVQLTLSANQNAYAYCYYQQHSGEIYQVFPTPFTPANALFANQHVEVPGNPRLLIKVESPGPDEKIQCVAHRAADDIALPQRLTELSFEQLSDSTLDDVFQQHKAVNPNLVLSDTFVITVN